ncbi:MAG: hypothetical protein ABEK00_00710 [Candidatus Nanohaloarchaea archaeon]
MDPVYTKEQMNRSLVSPVQEYEALLEDGGPDIVQVFGAPNNYEARTRFYGGESDLLHNLEYGNNIEDVTMIVPEGVQEAVSAKSINNLLEEGVDIQSPDRDLYTTADDWKSALDIAGDNDTINGHTSDYHGLKSHLTGVYGLDQEVNTFGHPTERSQREELWKHNGIMQTGDTLRQLYKMAREKHDF